MNVVDCRPERVRRLLPLLAHARTFPEAARLLREQRRVEAEVAQGVAEVNRAAQGWLYMSPER